MPLNEARSFRRSNLTKQQREDAMAAIYGLHITPKDLEMQTITQQEADRLREILAEHDKKNSNAPTKEFDLNNPPYQRVAFKEYPKVLYHHEFREYGKANNASEEQALKAEGFQNEPFSEEVDVALDPQLAAEAANIQKQIDALKGKKRGRPKKVA